MLKQRKRQTIKGAEREKDYKKIARDVSNIGHWGNGDYEVIISDKDDLDYLFDLIKQVYKVQKLYMIP